jgi:hypothetical protein
LLYASSNNSKYRLFKRSLPTILMTSTGTFSRKRTQILPFATTPFRSRKVDCLVWRRLCYSHVLASSPERPCSTAKNPELNALILMFRMASWMSLSKIYSNCHRPTESLSAPLHRKHPLVMEHLQVAVTPLNSAFKQMGRVTPPRTHTEVDR